MELAKEVSSRGLLLREGSKYFKESGGQSAFRRTDEVLEEDGTNVFPPPRRPAGRAGSEGEVQEDNIKVFIKEEPKEDRMPGVTFPATTPPPEPSSFRSSATRNYAGWLSNIGGGNWEEPPVSFSEQVDFEDPQIEIKWDISAAAMPPPPKKDDTATSETVANPLVTSDNNQVEVQIGSPEETRAGERGFQFQCSLCLKKLSSARGLRVHMRVHTGEKPYHCSHCGRQFADESNLRRHFRVHTGGTPYQSTHCVWQFKDRTALLRHLQVHNAEKRHQCPHCGERFGRRSSLQRHLLRLHMAGKSPYAFGLCYAKFSSNGLLQTHKRTHHHQEGELRRVTPQDWDYGTGTRAGQLGGTGRNENNPDDDDGSPPVTVISLTGLDAAPSTTSSSAAITWNYSDCVGHEKGERGGAAQGGEGEAEWNTQQNCTPEPEMELQNPSVHTDSKTQNGGWPFLMPNYNKRASTTESPQGDEAPVVSSSMHYQVGVGADEARDGAQMEHDDEVAQFADPLIETKLEIGPILMSMGPPPTAHLETNRSRQWTREPSGSSSRRNKKNFTCPTCNMSFGYKHHLQNHERTHTGERPYKCTYHASCDKRFAQSWSLRCHLRTHTGERPYVCKMCSLTFAHSSALKRHMGVHQEPPPPSPAITLGSGAHLLGIGHCGSGERKQRKPTDIANFGSTVASTSQLVIVTSSNNNPFPECPTTGGGYYPDPLETDPLAFSVGEGA